jgi:hypothetical protein
MISKDASMKSRTAFFPTTSSGQYAHLLTVAWIFFICLLLGLSASASTKGPLWHGIAAAAVISCVFAARPMYAWWQAFRSGVAKIDIGPEPLRHGQPHTLRFHLPNDIRAMHEPASVRVTIGASPAAFAKFREDFHARAHAHNSPDRNIDHIDSGYREAWHGVFAATAVSPKLVQCTVTLPEEMPSSMNDHGRTSFDVQLSLQADGCQWQFQLPSYPAVS